jgi:pimeloyl-ACP methyl ester carboxylesterase
VLSINKYIINGSKRNKILVDVCYDKNSLKKDIVIFSHGFKGFKDWGPFNHMSETFAKAGYFFVKFNFSYNGTSLDNPVEFVDLESFGNNNFSIELDDLGLVIDWLNTGFEFRDEINIDNINLLGHSRGGAISILKANEDDRVSKVISWASPSDFTNRIDDSKLDTWKKKGVTYIYNSRTQQNMPMYYQFYIDCIKNMNRIDINKAVINLDKPHLVVHGSDDPTVLINDAYDFIKWNSKTIFYEIKDANHVFGVMHPYDLEEYPIHFQEAIDVSLNFLES